MTEALRKLAATFNNLGDGFIHVETRDGMSEVLLAGDGTALIASMIYLIRRTSQKFDMEPEELSEMIGNLAGGNVEIPENVIVNGERIPYEETSGYREQLEAEYRQKERDIDKERQGFIDELKRKDIRINELRSKLEGQRKTHDQEKKALQKELRSQESIIRRLEAIIKGETQIND